MLQGGGVCQVEGVGLRGRMGHPKLGDPAVSMKRSDDHDGSCSGVEEREVYD